MEKQKKVEKSFNINSDELLLAIPQAEIQIYPRFILLLFTQNSHKNTLNMKYAIKQHSTHTSTLNLDNEILSKKNQKIDQNKCISLIDNNLVFSIEQQQKSISLIDVKSNDIILKFTVNSLSTLLIVQSILRDKLCELGFEKKYSIIKKIGKGASAQVYLCQRISDSKLFAVKIISLSQVIDKAYELFINEVKLLRILKHKHIVKLQSIYFSKKKLYQVLQYLSGGTLLEQLRQKVIKSDTQKMRVIYHLTLGLQHMRQKMIVHRDLKLQNILIRLNEDGSKDYVISDFGLGCWLGQNKPVFERCGTPGYIAPQILLDSNRNKCILTHLCDIFSLGAIIHFVLLSRGVFKYDGSAFNLLQCNKKADINFKKKFYSYLSSDQLQLLKVTLAVDPKDRATSSQLLDRYIFYNQQTKTQKKQKKLINSSGKSLDSKTSIRTDIISNRKIQMKQVKQTFSSKSLNKSLSKVKQSIDNKLKSQKKHQKSKSLFTSIFQKLTFSGQKQASLRKKKQMTSMRKIELSQFTQ